MKKLTALVLIADDIPDLDGEVFDLSGLKFEEQVRVEIKPLVPIGKAKLRLEGNNLYADMEIVPSYTGKYIPSVVGQVLVKEKIDNKIILRQTKIFSIALGDKNSDPRIPEIEL